MIKEYLEYVKEADEELYIELTGF